VSEPADAGTATGISHAADGRFPGFNALDQAVHWDPVTAGVVLSRLGRPPGIRFFTPAEEAAATALCDRLLGQDGEPKIPVVPQIDARLAEQAPGETGTPPGRRGLALTALSDALPHY
jgi:hypothetical protein